MIESRGLYQAASQYCCEAWAPEDLSKCGKNNPQAIRLYGNCDFMATGERRKKIQELWALSSGWPWRRRVFEGMIKT